MDVSFLRQRALALWSEAQLYHRSGHVEQAIQLYSRSIDLFPTAEAYTFRGWAYSSQQRWTEAIAECRRAIEVDPTLGNPYNDIGTYLLAQGKRDESVDWFQKAKNAKRYDFRHYPFMNLGRIYALNGMIKSAIAEFEGALALHPGNAVCVACLAELKRMLQ
jgi:tetratricopeptide (TPR) repeat protein